MFTIDFIPSTIKGLTIVHCTTSLNKQVEYGTTLPDLLYVLCIVLLYWVIAPVILLFAIALVLLLWVNPKGERA